jgi:hypothetical protein
VFKLLQPSAEAERRRGFHRVDVETHAAMSDAALAERAANCMKNSAGGVLGVKWLPGEAVYDGSMIHVVIPEMIKRLANREVPMCVRGCGPLLSNGACSMCAWG